MVDNLNSLASVYGVTYAEFASEPSGYTVTDFQAYTLTQSLNEIGIDYQRRLQIIAPPAIDLTIFSDADF